MEILWNQSTCHRLTFDEPESFSSFSVKGNLVSPLGLQHPTGPGQGGLSLRFQPQRLPLCWGAGGPWEFLIKAFFKVECVV